ncbi:MAG TPA: PH domain-containing protein [Pyrinomonadaceae bacterium]|nr:PH domain-containing protein [Pyrinomonadaceae bacterium]
MRYCSNCGGAVGDAARFCPACGASSDDDVTRVASEETRVRPSQTLAPRAPNVPARVEPIPQAVAPRSDARPSRQDDDIERVVFTVRPTLLFVKIGYALAALAALATVILLSFVSAVPVWVSVPFALALLLIPAYYHARRMMVRYTLTDSKLEIDEGFISQTTRNIPLRNIQDVTVKTTVHQRLLGFGDVLVDNANEAGGPTVLDDIPDPRRHMDMILRELRRWR